MRPVVLARLDKTRPAVLLTREAAAGAMSYITVAPITSTVRGLAMEVPVGPRNGLDHDSVVSCDNIQTIAATDVGRQVGVLYDDDEVALANALAVAFDLRFEALTDRP